MYEGYKFNNLKDIVLYVIAKARKVVSRDDISSELPGIQKENVFSTIKKLENDNLLKNFNKETVKKALWELNIKNMTKKRCL